MHSQGDRVAPVSRVCVLRVRDANIMASSMRDLELSYLLELGAMVIAIVSYLVLALDQLVEESLEAHIQICYQSAL